MADRHRPLTRQAWAARLLTVTAILFSLALPAFAAPLAAVSVPSRPSLPAPDTSPPGPGLPVPDLGLAPGERLVAVLVTSLGDVRCTLDHAASPVSVANFVALARGEREWVDPIDGESTRRPLYDGTLFHRVVPGFLVQGGDPSGTGTGGPGYSVVDEAAGSVFDRAGILALANRGPNTGGSQFFVTLGPARHIDGRYTPLGTCASLAVLERIAAVPRGERNRPLAPPVLRSVRIEKQS
ncbi:MAG: peptidylprolyl isomerase [Deltaproteobacteria bacterium]|nr:peptidylprolyl isomerase [Deltaproteobacteria bacterium]